MAADRGLARYGQARDSWTYYTRAGGMLDDPGQTLAFDKSGTLYLGLAGGGIGIATAADGYKAWQVVAGPAHVPDVPSGSGLPSALINALLVARDGLVYAGTKRLPRRVQLHRQAVHHRQAPPLHPRARQPPRLGSQRRQLGREEVPKVLGRAGPMGHGNGAGTVCTTSRWRCGPMPPRSPTPRRLRTWRKRGCRTFTMASTSSSWCRGRVRSTSASGATTASASSCKACSLTASLAPSRRTPQSPRLWAVSRTWAWTTLTGRSRRTAGAVLT